MNAESTIFLFLIGIFIVTIVWNIFPEREGFLDKFIPSKSGIGEGGGDSVKINNNTLYDCDNEHARMSWYHCVDGLVMKRTMMKMKMSFQGSFFPKDWI